MVLGILASLGVAAFLLMNGTPISRIYYGTDTHLYGLLLGALLAFARPWSRYTRRWGRRRCTVWLSPSV